MSTHDNTVDLMEISKENFDRHIKSLLEIIKNPTSYQWTAEDKMKAKVERDLTLKLKEAVDSGEITMNKALLIGRAASSFLRQ